ncbi:MAG: class C beta-lactamase-related serine hydrolase [Betaproteobacteria bacterium]|nr:class C beta-lactamase-related serine hydrolase [Betaproteobacteria bacterium]
MSTDEAVIRPQRRGLKIFVGAIVLALAVSIGAGFPIVSRMTAVGAGFFAKQLCSEVFVAGRDPKHVVDTDLRYFFPRALMLIAWWKVDREAGVTRASFAGLGARVAEHRGDAGCALAPIDAPTRATLDQRMPLQAISTGSAAAPLPWIAVPATNVRLNALIDQAFTEANAEPASQRRTRAIVVVHNGRLLAERYAEGFDASSRFPGWSIAKSVTHALVGALVADGRVKLEGRVSLPEWQSDDRRAISWDQLLRMKSGLAFDETYAKPFSGVNAMLWLAADAGQYAAAKPATSAPGSTWHYASGTSNIITNAMRAVLGDADHAEFPRRALFDRIGMASAIMEKDGSGNLVGSSFIYATALDYAKFGWLYAMDGIWDGTRILPAGWVRHAMQPTEGSSGRYGAHFGLNSTAEEVESFKDVPPAMLHATGFGGQWVTILPAERLVIVRLGQTMNRTSWVHLSFVAAVREAIAFPRLTER